MKYFTRHPSGKMRRRKRQPKHAKLRPMEAYTPRIRHARWVTKAHFVRYHPTCKQRGRGAGVWTHSVLEDFFEIDPDTGDWQPKTRQTHRRKQQGG